MKPKQVKGPGLKLDLGCGNNKREGFLGVDLVKTDATDYVHDLFRFPWPFGDGEVAELHCSHFFEHVPALLRPKFMDECYRVLVPGGQMQVIVPYYSSMRAIQDFTHEWPPIAESSFLYFNKGWRDQNKLVHGHYAMKCDFDFVYGYALDADLQVRNVEFQRHAVKSDINAVADLIVTLTRR